MNSLSWMIYLAGVCEKLGGVSMALAIGSGIALFGAGFVYMVSEGEVSMPQNMRRTAFIVLLISSLTAALMPNQRTVYLIAASEAGQQVAQSDAGQELLTETRRILMNKLRQYGKEDEK